MKKFRLSLLLLSLLLSVVGARADNVLTVYDGEDTNQYVPIYGWYADAYLKSEFVIPEDELSEMTNGTINSMTFYLSQPAAEPWGDANFQVFLKEVGDASISEFYGLEGATVVYKGSLDGTQSTMTIEFTTPYEYGGGNLLVGVYNTSLGKYKSATFLGEIVDGASISNYSYSGLDAITSGTQRDFIPKTTFTYTPGEAPSCIKPKGITVSDITSKSATLSWESDADAWVIGFVRDDDGSIYKEMDVDENPYTLSLAASTPYTLRVRAICSSSDKSDWSNPVTFTTEACEEEEKCLITYELTDDYGDGWNGNKINVVDDEMGVVLDTWTFSSGRTATGSLAVCPGSTLNFVWVKGSYSDECSFVIKDVNENVIFEFVKNDTGPTAGVLETYTVDCTASPCSTPRDFAASDLNYATATLSWTEIGESEEWIIYYMAEDDEEVSSVTVTSNPYTFEGLQQGTTYYAMVAPTCDEGKLSDMISFTTLVACAMPTDVTVSNIEAHSVDVSWTGTSDMYLIRYKVSGASDWTTQSADMEAATLSGLTPETTYQFQVQGDCGDFQSKWTTIGTFTTLESCVTPTELSAVPAPTSASLKWKGNSDGYNVRYRVSEFGEPFFEDFENGIDDWKIVRNDEGTSSTDWHVISPSSYGISAHSGSKVAMSRSWYSSDYSVDNWLITPKVTLYGTLKFWVMDDGMYHDHYDIYVSTESDELEDFVLFASPGNANSTWTEVTVDLSSFAGVPGYIAIRHTDENQDFLFIDDFGIYPPEEAGGEWNVVTATEPPFVLIGLDPETTYQYQVQGDCGEEQSKWSTSDYFTTLAECPVPFDIVVEPDLEDATFSWTGFSDSYNLRYRIPADVEKFFFEDFENCENGLPDTWTTIDNDGDGNNWYLWDTEANDVDTSDDMGNPTVFDKKCATSASYNSNVLNPDNWLISPRLDLKGRLSVWLRGQDPEYVAEHFAIYLSLKGNTVDDFLDDGSGVVLVDETVAKDVYTEYTADLSEYRGRKGYIAIRHFNCTNQFRLNVDNFALLGDDIPAGEWVDVTNVEDTEYEITGLEPGTTYEYQVQGVCDETATAWSEIDEFTTLIAVELLNDDIAEDVKNSDKLTELIGKNVAATLSGRTFFKDGKWNSLCLPFSLTEEQIAKSPLAGATIKKLYDGGVDGTHVNIIFNDAEEIEAGWWYIFKWESGEDIVNPIFKNVEVEDAAPYNDDSTDNGHFKIFGNYDSFEIDPAKDGCYTYYLTSDGSLKYSDKYRVLKTFRIFFRFTADNDAGALEFNLDFGDGDSTTGIVELDGTGRDNRAPEGYYNLQGVKYNGKPIQKGVYINNGHKVVVK